MDQAPILNDFQFKHQADPAADESRVLPHVISWNLTRRCNLECSHCYISAGPWYTGEGELTLEECRRITDEIVALNPGPMFILTGGEPLVRDDLEDIAAYASSKGVTVVVGTNGTGLTAERIQSLKTAGVTGFAISVDSLRAQYHDRFRHGDGALADTIASIERLRDAQLDFIIQTTITTGNRDELDEMVAWSAEMGAVSFNLYFLVQTGRGAGMRDLTPDETESVLTDLTRLQKEYRGRMLVRSKCQPALMRHVHAADPESPLLNYSTRCPCGVLYCRITPEGKLTPCPYLPVEAGDLRNQSFGDAWKYSRVFSDIRKNQLGGKCGQCEYREICGGCRASAYAQSDPKDYMASDERCVYEPSGEVPVITPTAPVTYGMPSPPKLTWTPDAEARMNRIPSFVRGVVVKRVEDYAEREGHDVITIEILDNIRKDMPVDFSKRLPFFLRRKK